MKKFVVVYDAKTDEVLAFGSPEECAKALNLSINTIYKYMYDQRQNISSSSRYYVYELKE